MLTVTGLNKGFQKKQVLRGFTYTFEHGVYGLLGPNGAGKTTLMRLLTKLYPDKQGAIAYNGEPIHKSQTYLNHVGYLPQKFGLFKDLKLYDALQLMASLKGIGKQEADGMIRRSLELVNLSDSADSRVGTLSGGMVRRAGIAQAILNDPDVIIFDEPTAGLDPEERLRFKNLVAELRGERTILISTHIVEDVEAVCDHVAIMADGKVAAEGSCKQIADIARGKVYLLPEAQKEELLGDYVVQKHLEKDGERLLKVLSAAPQPFDAVSPDVEDGYICALNKI